MINQHSGPHSATQPNCTRRTQTRLLLRKASLQLALDQREDYVAGLLPIMQRVLREAQNTLAIIAAADKVT
jgi:hypothetical protein